MAKKARRGRRPPQRKNVTVQPPVPAARLAAVESSSPTLPASRADSGQTGSRKAPDFRAEYQYVLADLKRVGTLAAVLLAALVVLSFFV